MPYSIVRLAILDAVAIRWQEATARLRGVVLQSCAADVPALDAFDAAAFFDPASATRERIERCLEAGKPVLMAANACPSLATLEALTRAASSTSPPLVIVNPERYLPSRQLIRQQLDAGKLGEPGLIRLHHWESSAQSPSSLASDLDVVAWLFGKTPNLVYAVETRADHLGVQIHLGFPGGGMGLITVSPGDNRYCSLTVIGSAGAAYADDHPNMQLAMQSGSVRAVRSEEDVTQWTALLRDFLATIRKGRTDAHAMSWHNALMVGDAVRQSLHSRQAVQPPAFRPN